MLNKRISGILLHISSLPSDYGIGDFGPDAYKFVDFLAKTKQTYWQILPLNPTNPFCGNSPYNSISAFAGNTLFISPQELIEDGLLSEDDIQGKPEFSQGFCDYSEVISYKEKLFDIVYENFKKSNKDKDGYETFCRQNHDWLDNYALFVVIKKNNNEEAWVQWPKDLRDRKLASLDKIRKGYSDELEREKFLQYLFFKQLFALKKYCNSKGIKLMGDIPIYVSHDSVDVWAHTNIFKLDKDKKPVFVAGVPPDYFSATGQLWGNPVYKWSVLKKSGYSWWIRRLRQTFNLFDIIRIDHFRGLVAFWQVSYGETTAINGKWVKAPVVDFINTLIKKFGKLPIIAEDLGIITPDVRKAMKQFNIPGMRVLHFAFGEDNPQHPYLPQNYIKNCLVYTGTHDNNTTTGWFEQDIDHQEKERLFKCLGHKVSAHDISWALIGLAFDSIANVVIIPMQDILGLSAAARMNRPSIAYGNWEWRLMPDQIDSQITKKLLGATQDSKRAR
jgi:4-alpha-glucanotransferase